MTVPLYIQDLATFNVLAGFPVIVAMQNVKIPTTVNVIPGSSGTMLVEGSSGVGDNDPTTSTGTWESWIPGTVSASTTQTLYSRYSYLRFTATTSNGVANVIGA